MQPTAKNYFHSKMDTIYSIDYQIIQRRILSKSAFFSDCLVVLICSEVSISVRLSDKRFFVPNEKIKFLFHWKRSLRLRKLIVIMEAMDVHHGINEKSWVYFNHLMFCFVLVIFKFNHLKLNGPIELIFHEFFPNE